MDDPAAYFQDRCRTACCQHGNMEHVQKYQAEGGAGSSIGAMPWEIMLELVKRMDSKDRSAWRLANKAACQAVYEGSTALAPNSTAWVPEEPSTLPLPLLSKCSGLEQLSCVKLWRIRGVQGLPPGLKMLDISMTSVTDLSPLRLCTGLRQLSATDMEGSIGITQLAAALLQLTGLQQLNLGSNYWGEPCTQALAPALQRLAQLQHLDLSSNDVGPVGVMALAPAIQGMAQLRHLDLSGNIIGVVGAQVLARALQRLTGLQELWLGSNTMNAEAAQALAPALQHLTGLQQLGLGDNEFREEGARALAPAIQRLTRLQQLDLSENHMGPAAVMTMMPHIKELKALTSLDLSYNHNLLGAEAAQALALALRELTGLQRLKLSDYSCYHLTPGAAQALALLAPAIKALPRLEVMLTNGARALLAEAVAALPVDA